MLSRRGDYLRNFYYPLTRPIFPQVISSMLLGSCVLLTGLRLPPRLEKNVQKIKTFVLKNMGTKKSPPFIYLTIYLLHPALYKKLTTSFEWIIYEILLELFDGRMFFPHFRGWVVSGISMMR